MATWIGQLETSDNFFHGETPLDTHIYIELYRYRPRHRYRYRHKHRYRYRHIGIQMDDQHRWTFWDILVSAMASWEAHDQNEWFQFENMVTLLKQHPTKGGLWLGTSSNYGECLPCVTGEYQVSTHSA